MVKLALSDEQRQQLQQLKRGGRNHEERWRASVIVDLGKALKRAQVAERNDCSVSGVDKTIARFRSGGVPGLKSPRFKPRGRKVGAAGLALLAEALRQTPRAACPGQPQFERSLWTLQLLVSYLQGQLGIAVSLETMRRYLLQMGWRTKSPKLSCRSPDPEYGAKMQAIGRLRKQAEKGGPAHLWSSTTTRPS